MTDRRLIRLQVENFRSLRSIDLPLGELTVLVGPNGTGKTNVLKVFGFLADVIRFDLESALAMRGGYDEVAFWGGSRPPETMRIALDAVWTDRATSTVPDEYELVIRRAADLETPEGYRLSREETFAFQSAESQARRIKVNGEDVTVTEQEEREEPPFAWRTAFDSPPPADLDDSARRRLGIQRLSSGLSTLPRLARTEGSEEVATVAQHLAGFRVFDVDVESARQPSRFTGRATLGSDAANLADFLLTLSLHHPDAWAQLAEDARRVVPNLDEIVFSQGGSSAREVRVELRERGLRHTTPLADASFGTVRLLSLLALFHDPNPPALTCIEEIDHGLHPHALSLIVERLREASQLSQYLVATHSPALADRLRPEELVVCERDEDGASLIPAVGLDHMREIVTAGDGLPLGELWFSGSLGGGLD
ncbi:ATPase [Streptomyces sp. XY431]|uniref:AAA family ATPase n=1 Tax=Streptomyces sp. XY431 TaxID=1415562 RepID=UPI0006AE508C|nr:AAA family ATPase [Streptomyces sp. XY431]KOV12132.1 ATPase [Streptomyces sp. XY431]